MKRYIGDAVVTLTWNESDDCYDGDVTVGDFVWPFQGLRHPTIKNLSPASPQMYDRAAVSACVFGGSATDKIDEAILGAMGPSERENNYFVNRHPNGYSYGPYT